MRCRRSWQHYTGHNYIGHNSRGHSYTGHNYVGALSPILAAGKARFTERLRKRHDGAGGTGTGSRLDSHNYVGHSYEGNKYVGHSYVGHSYIGHSYIGVGGTRPIRGCLYSHRPSEVAEIVTAHSRLPISLWPIRSCRDTYGPAEVACAVTDHPRLPI